MEFRVLGVLEALRDGQPVSLGGPKQRSVLAMLLLNANRSVSTEHLVDGLWGDEPPLRAAATLQVYVSNLRKALEPDRSPRAVPSVLLTQPPGYALAIDPDDIDLLRFERLVASARALKATGCEIGAAVLFREALDFWRDAPLADLHHEPFAAFEVPRLNEARTGATEDRIEMDLMLGRDVELLPELEALVARNPYRERLRCQLLLALYRAGRQADALAAYQSARDALVDELGLEPGRELREMEAAILVHDTDLAPPELLPLGSDDVIRVMRETTGRTPDELTVSGVVDEGRQSARRGEEALRRAIDRERANRLSATLEAAGESRVEFARARHVIADVVLDRRRRRTPRRTGSEPVLNGKRSSNGNEPCPYKGLLRFEPEDAAWYHGRERLVAELLASVATTRCTGVVGASGSGKSSLTRAGLLAALRDDALPGSAEWPRVLVTPGADPMLELARALAPVCHTPSADRVRDQLLEDPSTLSGLAARATNGAGERASVVIVVDQLEEVFTVCRDDGIRQRFLDVLVHGATDGDAPTRILTAIRADYFGRCADHAAFAELLAPATVLVGVMRPDELQRAIEEPARAAGLTLEDGLVERIFDDVSSEPGALPLLETALLETWNRRRGRTLTVAGYLASGGVKGAVAHLADDVYARMSSSQQAVARGIFLRLAEPGVGSDDVRRRAPLEELVVDDAHAATLRTLIDHRLVVAGDTTAEVAHEALLREWPRLRGWLEEDREGRRVQRALTNAAREWDDGTRDDDLLFRGTRLVAALDVAGAHPAEITPVERQFLAAGRARQESDLDEARRTARRFRRLTVALALLLVLAIAAALFAVQRGSDASRSETRAQLAARLRDASRLAGQSATSPDDQFDRRLLLAVEAHRLAPGAETEGALVDALTREPPTATRTLQFDPPASIAGITRAGTLVAAPETDGTVRIIEVATGDEVRRFSTAPDGDAMIAQFSADGRWLALGSSGGAVTVWSVAHGTMVAGPLRAGDGPAFGVFDPTTRTRLFVPGHDGVVSVWNLSDPHHPRRRVLASTTASSSPAFPVLAFPSQDGRRVLVGDTANNVGAPSVVLDTGDGAVVGTFDAAPGALSSDGRLAAIRRADQAVEVVDVGSGSVVSAPMPSLRIPGSVMSFDRSDRRLAVTDQADKRVHVIDWRTGSEIADPVDVSSENPLPMFVDQDRLYVRTSTRAAVADLSAASAVPSPFVPPIAQQLSPLADSSSRVTAGGRLVTDSASSIAVSNFDGSASDEVRVPARVVGVPFTSSPDRRTLLTARDDGTVELLDRGTGRSHGTFRRQPGTGVAVWWSPDSSTVAFWSSDGKLYVWPIDRSNPRRLVPEGVVGPPPGPFTPNIEVAWRPDSRELLVALHTAGVATTFDVDTGRRRAVVRLQDGGLLRGGVSYRPDGRAFALATYTDVTSVASVIVVDDETGTVLERHVFEHALRALTYYDDGKRLATLDDGRADPGGESTTLELWDTTGMFPIGSGVTLPGIQTRLTVSPEQSHLLIVDRQGSPQIWDLRTRRWVDAACAAAGRTLTHAEWQRYLPGRPYAPVCR